MCIRDRDVYERIAAFKDQSSDLLDTYGNGAKQHYQNENSITTYLWLRYPDTYYIYKLSEVKKVADVLHCDYRFKKGAYRDNLQHFYKIYDEICEELKLDTELVNLFRSHLTDTCYPDPVSYTHLDVYKRQLLDSIRRGRLKNVPLKAMLTPNNISWTIETILQELSKEHEYFHKKR